MSFHFLSGRWHVYSVTFMLSLSLSVSLCL
jgi:hypothetical protein